MFKEFSNPVEKDYNINNSFGSISNTSSIKPYSKQLYGILEDTTEDDYKNTME